MCNSEGQVTGFVRERHYNDLPKAERPEGLVFEYAVTLGNSGETWFFLLTEAQWKGLVEAPDVRPGIEAHPAGDVVKSACLKKLVEFIQAEGVVLKDAFTGALY